MDTHELGHEYRVTALRILIIEDDQDFADGLADILRLEGYSVAVSPSCEQAMEIHKEESFHLALLDMQLPGVNGVECARVLRELDPELIVFIVTGYSAENLKDEALQAGVREVLQKPLRATAFMTLVRNALSNQPGGAD